MLSDTGRRLTTDESSPVSTDCAAQKMKKAARSKGWYAKLWGLRPVEAMTARLPLFTFCLEEMKGD